MNFLEPKEVVSTWSWEDKLVQKFFAQTWLAGLHPSITLQEWLLQFPAMNHHAPNTLCHYTTVRSHLSHKPQAHQLLGGHQMWGRGNKLDASWGSRKVELYM